jgi:teichuronic acid biosynthesis glycosyltransferase TuaG
MSYRNLLSNTAIATSTVIIDRTILPDLRQIETSKIYVEDYILFFGILKAGEVAYGLNKELMLYRVQPNSFSRNKLKYALKVWRTYRFVEGLGRLETISYFSRYAVRGILKYLRF